MAQQRRSKDLPVGERRGPLRRRHPVQARHKDAAAAAAVAGHRAPAAARHVLHPRRASVRPRVAREDVVQPEVEGRRSSLCGHTHESSSRVDTDKEHVLRHVRAGGEKGWAGAPRRQQRAALARLRRQAGAVQLLPCARIFSVAVHIHTQPRTQDAQASNDSREGRDSNDSQKPALGTRKANAMTASSVSSS